MITSCQSGFRFGDFSCESNYSGEKIRTVNYSILMDIRHEYCNMCCKYCCCHPKPKDTNLKDYFKLDKEKLIAKIKETDEKRGLKHCKHTFEIWGGEPLFNFDAFVETVATLEDAFPGATFSTSTNGLVLKDDKICDYLITHRFRLQLSHDGLGQHLRGKDPLKDDLTKANIVSLAQMGILTSINCTLSQTNNSWYNNIKYWEDIFGKYINKLYIKLNHPYNSDYRFEFAFTDEEKTNKFMSEFIQLYWQCYYDKLAYLPFRRYILEQGNRYTKGETGSCRAYQSYKYNVEGNRKQDWNFVIMTNGEYGECNLSAKVDNPGGIQPDYCKDCEFKDYSECKQCGAMNYPIKCFYMKKWMRTLKLLDRGKQYVKHYSQQRRRTSNKQFSNFNLETTQRNNDASRKPVGEICESITKDQQ